MWRQTPFIACWIAVACGCARDAPPPPAPVARTEDVALQVLVVDEPQIAKAIERLRGDWAELSGGSLTVTGIGLDDFSADNPQAADVVIYPARYLGALIEQERIRPLRESIREAEALAFNEILPAIREGELAYGGAYYAVPFGSRVLIRVARPDESAPAAVAEAETSSPDQTSAAGETSSAEIPELPADQFAAALTLLAQAAPKTSHPSQVAVLFDLESMTPKIDGPVFVRALQELVAATEREREASTQSPQWQWWPPQRSEAPANVMRGDASEVLPVSEYIYDANAGAWVKAATPSVVPLVGGKSWIGSVTAASRNAPAAFRLLAWLSGGSGQGAGGVSVAPVRRGTADRLVEAALSRSTYLQVPRILEVDSYLSTLDEYVRRALQGEVAPDEALKEAARSWDEITGRVGRERQRSAYRKHLNLP